MTQTDGIVTCANNLVNKYDKLYISYKHKIITLFIIHFILLIGLIYYFSLNIFYTFTLSSILMFFEILIFFSFVLILFRYDQYLEV